MHRTPQTAPAALPAARQQQAAHLLKTADLHPTRMRVQVVATMLGHRDSILPATVYRELSAAFSLSSIYRAMAEMHRLGLLERHRLLNGKLAYRPKRSGGPIQATCRGCGRAADLANAELQQALRQACALAGFAGASISISALCGRCSPGTAQVPAAAEQADGGLTWLAGDIGVPGHRDQQ